MLSGINNWLTERLLASGAWQTMLWECAKPADAYPGANTPYAQAIKTRDSHYIFETPDYYYQRAQLADKIRKAVLSQ